MTLLSRVRFLIGLAATVPWLVLSAGESPPLPQFEEVYELVRSNLTYLNQTELNRAAVEGFISQLQPRVLLADKVTPSDAPEIAKSTVYEDSFGYIRIGRMDSDTPAQLAAAIGSLNSKSKLKGLILDLRFAEGSEYKAAAEAADQFLKADLPLLEWEGKSIRSTSKTKLWTLPVALLVNQKTSGAAEVLIAILREADAGLIIGSATAGLAQVFQEFNLSNGTRLRLAAMPVKFGNGLTVSPEGVRPDIKVSVSEEEERAYLEDPYQTLSQKLTRLAGGNSASTNAPAGAAAGRPTNRRRFSEADLVRLQREGQDLDPDLSPKTNTGEPEPMVIRDPVLARGLDLLKGLAVVQHNRTR